MADPHSIALGTDLTAAATSAAAWRDMSLDDYVREVVATAARMDAELAAFVQEGEDDFARGDFITHEELVADLRERRNRRNAA